MASPLVHKRRYDLDWLRIVAFGLLILYHIGLSYTTWGWHIMSPYSGRDIEPVMRMVNPWRMPLIFFISGVALRFAADKNPGLTFIVRRILRLGIPLLFGMFIVNAPQTYMELRLRGEVGIDFWHFFGDYLTFSDAYPARMPTWNHLWYLVFLMPYSIIALVFMPRFRALAERLDSEKFAHAFRGWRIFVLPALVFLFYIWTLDRIFPNNHKFFQDMGAHARYFSYFLIGILAAKNGTFWGLIAAGWRQGLLIALGTGFVLMLLWGYVPFITDERGPWHLLWSWRTLYAWAVLASLLGLAQAYVNRPGPKVKYLSDAIFPYYVLHQPLIVIWAAWVYPFELGGVREFLLIAGLTALSCAMLYEVVIRRLPFIGPLFGAGEIGFGKKAGQTDQAGKAGQGA